MNMTKESIQNEVSRAIALDPGLSDALVVALGFRPQWSKLDLLGYLQVWLAYKSLQEDNNPNATPMGASYYDTFLAVSRLPEAQGNPQALRYDPRIAVNVQKE